MTFLFVWPQKIVELLKVLSVKKTLLRGIIVAVYIAGQERRLVDPPSQVVAGVRTVTTKMDERCDAHVAALVLFVTQAASLRFFISPLSLRAQIGGLR